jgi:hypothetical protein
MIELRIEPCTDEYRKQLEHGCGAWRVQPKNANTRVQFPTAPSLLRLIRKEVDTNANIAVLQVTRTRLDVQLSAELHAETRRRLAAAIGERCRDW